MEGERNSCGVNVGATPSSLLTLARRWFDERQVIADYHFPSIAGDGGRESARPSKTVMLRNVFDQDRARDPEFLKTVENEIGLECSNAGPIQSLEVIKDGSVAITYFSVVSAQSCVQVMNGRFYDEREIMATFDHSAQDGEPNHDCLVVACSSPVCMQRKPPGS